MNIKIKGNLLLLLITLLALCCHAQNKPTPDSTQLVYDAVEHLPEIKAYMLHADSLYGSKGVPPAMMIVADPTKETPYYWVQVGINDGDRLTPEYNFYVYPPKMGVKFLDTMKDEVISIQEWRRRRKK